MEENSPQAGSNLKQVMVLHTPGMNITTVPECSDCAYRRERFCQKWAFPEAKWRNGQCCPDHCLERIEN